MGRFSLPEPPILDTLRFLFGYLGYHFGGAGVKGSTQWVPECTYTDFFFKSGTELGLGLGLGWVGLGLGWGSVWAGLYNYFKAAIWLILASDTPPPRPMPGGAGGRGGGMGRGAWGI